MEKDFLTFGEENVADADLLMSLLHNKNTSFTKKVIKLLSVENNLELQYTIKLRKLQNKSSMLLIKAAQFKAVAKKIAEINGYLAETQSNRKRLKEVQKLPERLEYFLLSPSPRNSKFCDRYPTFTKENFLGKIISAHHVQSTL